MQDQAISILVYVLAGTIVVVGFFVRRARAQKREKVAVAFAAQEGFSMLADVAPNTFGFFSSDDDLRDLRPAPKGTQIQSAATLVIDISGCLPKTGDYMAQNVLVKHDGDTDQCVFDYTTIHRDTKGNRTYGYYGVVCMRVPLVLQRVELRPEDVFYKIGRAFGMKEIDFEVEGFNKKYFVTGADRKFAFDLLSPRAIDVLMRYPSRHWQFDGTFVVILRSGFFDYYDALRAIQEIKEVMATVEPFLKEECGIPPVALDAVLPHSGNPYTDSGVVP